MTEKDLKVFIDVTMNYFDKISGDQAGMEDAYINFDEPVLLDYTGIIRISGKSLGYVYVTSPAPMLEHLLRAIGETEITPETMGDFVGEIASTISSNVRRVFGGTFQISVPITLSGPKAQTVDFPFSMFIVPIRWKQYKSYLAIGIDNDED